MASPASVDAFRALNPEKQKAALGRMSPEAKQALLTGLRGSATEETSTGIRVPKGMVGASESKDNSVLGGFVRRGVETAKGLYHTLADPPTAEENRAVPPANFPWDNRPGVVASRLGKGLYEGEKETGRQAVSQFRQARDTSDDLTGKALRYSRAGVTGLSMLDPLATGSVTAINQREEEGRHREAVGSGVFDAFSLLLGGRTGRAPSEAKTLSRLSYATDIEKAANLRTVMPDLRETVAKMGGPQATKSWTVGNLQEAIQATSDRLDQTFNSALAPVAADPVIPTDIADALEAKARTLPRTAGREAAALRREAVKYRQKWTVGELNQERMYRNGLVRGFERKGGVAQMAAMRSSAETMVDKVAADSARDVLYGYLDKKFPGGNFRELKLKQSAILDMTDHFREHVEKIESAGLRKAGAPTRSKLGVSAVMSPGRLPHPFFHMPFTGDPMAWTNQATRTSFAPTTGATARRTGILALPASQLFAPRKPGKPGNLPSLEDDPANLYEGAPAPQ